MKDEYYLKLAEKDIEHSGILGIQGFQTVFDQSSDGNSYQLNRG